MALYLIFITYLFTYLNLNYANPDTKYESLSEALKPLVNISQQEKAVENLIHRILPMDQAKFFNVKIAYENENFGQIHTTEDGQLLIKATSGEINNRKKD